MLKLQQPDLSRQRTGGALLAILAFGMTAAVYAATPSPQARSGAGIGDRYTLKIDVAMGGRPDSMHFTRCVKPGEYTELSGTDTSQLSWQGRFAVSPAAEGQLEISAQIDTRFDRGGGKVRTQSAKPIVRTMPGQQASIVFGQVVDGKQFDSTKLEDNTIKLGVTPSNGCSGSSSALGNFVKIDQRAKGRSARALAESMAAKAGFVLVNPEALDNRPVALNFEQVPATSALQLIADIDGMRAVFHDNMVNFEPK